MILNEKKPPQLTPKNYLENPFYRRTPTTPTDSNNDRDLLQQALVPPSSLIKGLSHARSYYSSPPATRNYSSTNGDGNGSPLPSSGILPGRPRRRNTLRNGLSTSAYSADPNNGITSATRRGGDTKGGGFTGLWRAVPLIGRIFSSSTSTSNATVTRGYKSSSCQYVKPPNMEPLSDSGNADFSTDDNDRRKRRRRPSYNKHKYSSSSNAKSYFSFVQLAGLHLPAAVLTWYLLGVLSISTTKILLRDWGSYGVSPLFLTVQQFCIGVFFLRVWIQIQHRAPPRPVAFRKVFSRFSSSNQHQSNFKFHHHRNGTGSNSNYVDHSYSTAEFHLLISATCFALGFLITNQSFSNSDASFVETIKASEPLSSAATAVFWGLERLSPMEMFSLLGISGGVVLATLGNVHNLAAGTVVATTTTLTQSMQSSGTVLLSNLCFSFRGLYQKLFRASSVGNVAVMDDLNLQFRMQQFGILILIVPLLILELSPFIGTLMVRGGVGEIFSLVYNMFGWGLMKYAGLAFVNGFAFTHYNLASTYILTRISVVHHAALNCIRRLVAIVVTSFIFGIQITYVSGLGIIVSIAGFMAFTYYKTKRIKAPRPLSSLLPLSE